MGEAKFARVLRGGNYEAAYLLALELDRIGLDDAFELTILAAKQRQTTTQSSRASCLRGSPSKSSRRSRPWRSSGSDSLASCAAACLPFSLIRKWPIVFAACRSISR